MIRYTTGNLLEADVEALVNTVNTVGVMGKGIALMFKERFPHNMEDYVAACKASEVQVGRMFVTENHELVGPRWIINFPTKKHWRHPSKMEWIESGLKDLKAVIQRERILSIAIPPLGAGNGKLDWKLVRPVIEQTLSDLEGVDILVYEPTLRYQNVAKNSGLEDLTIARALILELIRRYSVLGIECSLLEIHKLAWFVSRAIQLQGLADPLKLRFEAKNYGPYAPNLSHLLNDLDGSFLNAEKRIPDSGPQDVIWFNDARKEELIGYLAHEGASYAPALTLATEMIHGFESPYGLELLSTVDWLVQREGVAPNVQAIRLGLEKWPAGEDWARRKAHLFGERIVEVALLHLNEVVAANH